jgi:hypothetical protein
MVLMFFKGGCIMSNIFNSNFSDSYPGTPSILNAFTNEIHLGRSMYDSGPRIYGGVPVTAEYCQYTNDYTIRLADRTIIGRAFKGPSGY